MPGDRFEFDESGDTFLCFLTAFYTLVLIPLTYFCWPSLEFKDSYEQTKRKCMCQPCQLKRHHLKSSTPLKRLKKIIIKGAFAAGWGIFFLLVYKLTLIEPDSSGFDPFSVLGINKDASAKDIRSAYKKLSLLNHPDKGGDPKLFIQISKAYNALTNDESRKNWEEYGNPDGPGAAHFGIALPKWMIQKENFYLVIGAYVLLFMMILPISVGTWWYNTMKFSNNNVLLDTIRYFCGTFMRSPYMAMPRIIKLIMQIPFFTIFKKAIVGSPYSVKARALIYAHLERLELPANTLHIDRQYIIKHSPRLIDEMINSLLYVLAVAMDEANSRHKTPQHLATIENCMHFIPMLVQALTDNASPLLQLPHITQTQLRHMATKQRNIKSIRQLVSLPEDKRRALLRSLSDEQYRDILINYLIDVNMVTVTVLLKRTPLLDPNAVNNANVNGHNATLSDLSYFDRNQTMRLDWNAYNNDSSNSKLYPIASDIHVASETSKSLNYDDYFGVEDKGCDISNPAKTSKKTAPPVWDKSKRKKGVRKSKSRKQDNSKRQQQQQQRNSLLESEKVAQPEIVADEMNSEQEDSDSVAGAEKISNSSDFTGLNIPSEMSVKVTDEPVLLDHIDDGQDQLKTVTDDPIESSLNTNKSASNRAPMKPLGKSSSMLDSKTHCTHVVHCPYFPVEKFEEQEEAASDDDDSSDMSSTDIEDTGEAEEGLEEEEQSDNDIDNEEDLDIELNSRYFFGCI
ncbi:Translocation protein SEC63 like [Schistosoma japonicum]|nr:Translocation protein SEC63 like [Schistosoma japonicum]